MGDLTAGIIVAILFIPQSMAYAVIAGVNPVIGLYAATFPLLIYTLVSSSKHLSVGPVSIVSLLAFNGAASIAGSDSVVFYQVIVMISILVGIFQLAFSLCKVGRLFSYISPTVISGFTSAVAIIICLNQVEPLLGISLPNSDHLQVFAGIVNNLSNINPYTLVIGIGSLLLLIIFKKVLPISIGPLIIIIFTTIAVAIFDLNFKGVAIIGDVPKGLPQLVLPHLNVSYVSTLFPVGLAIASISFLESYAVARSIADKEKYQIDPNIELKGLGLANLVSGFIGSIPVAGAVSRTAVNYQSGAKSKLSSITSIVIIFITLLYFTPYFYYLPKASLAAIIIFAACSLIDVKTCVHLMKNRRADGLIFIITLVISLVNSILLGLLIGVLLSLIKALLSRIVVIMAN